jgi:hypothetical protein
MFKGIYGVLFVLAAFLISCSEKDEVLEKTFQVNASFSFSNTQVWPERYQIIAGAFGSDTTNPLVYKIISNPGEEVATNISLTGIPESASNIKLYIANHAKQPVHTLSEQSVSAKAGNLELTNSKVSLLTYTRIQKQVFSSCTVCHGGSSGSPAAGLNLMFKQSYANLVNHISMNSTKMRVEPGNVNNSFLTDVLRKKQSIFTHTASNTIAEEDIILIEHWIETGAQNN